MIDKTPPEIKPFQDKDTLLTDFEGKIKFTVTDDLSGVSKWDCYVDENWVLTEYDPKYNLLFYCCETFKQDTCLHTMTLIVSDKKENQTAFNIVFRNGTVTGDIRNAGQSMEINQK